MNNILFICSKNQWRSPTAESLFRKNPNLSVRSAGTSSSARRQGTLNDIQWADIILVMEDKHKSRLKVEFRRHLEYIPLHVLDIPDDYPFMDPQLIEILEQTVPTYLP
ncbi:MAG: phosphotyrosine protein phosphatase [Halopseudomonas aestusnigri]